MGYYHFKNYFESVKNDIDKACIGISSEDVKARIDSMIEYYADEFPLNQLGLPNYWTALILRMNNIIGMLEFFPSSIKNQIEYMKQHFEKSLKEQYNEYE